MEENKIVIYQTEDGQTQIDVRLENEMIWLTRQQLADLFGRDYKTISKHINNALKEELADSVVVAKFANTTQHGAIEGKTQTHEKEYFNLEMVTSVGYRVKSKRGVQFRKWANRVLKEYLVKGYAVNERIRKEQIGELRQLVGMLDQRVCKLHSFTDNYLPQYAYFILPMLLKGKNDVTYATTVKHLSSNDIQNFSYLVPSLSEQQKIAN